MGTGYLYPKRPQLPPLYPAKRRQTGALENIEEHWGVPSASDCRKAPVPRRSTCCFEKQSDAIKLLLVGGT